MTAPTVAPLDERPLTAELRAHTQSSTPVEAAVSRLHHERHGITARLIAGDPNSVQLRARLAVVEADIARHENGAPDPFHRLPAVTGDEL